MTALSAVTQPAKTNAQERAEPNAGWMALAKKWGATSNDAVDAGSGCHPGTVAAPASRVLIGFSPRKAPNSAPVGLEATTPVRIPWSGGPTWAEASAWPTEAVNPVDKPTMTMVKKIAMEICWPAFWRVASIPEAAPRFSAGTEFITAAAFGAANIPIPHPCRKSRVPSSQYWKLMGSSARPKKVAEPRAIPRVAIVRGPRRSEIQPLSGPAARKPKIIGIMNTPAHRGVSANE